MTSGQLVKQLKAVGFVPPNGKEPLFKEIYKAVQPFLLERVNDEIKAAYFAITLGNDAHWGRSLGILTRVENGFLYAAGLVDEDSIKVIGFGDATIPKMHLTQNEKGTAFVGWHFNSEGRVYSFKALNGEIPKEFLKELVELEKEFNLGSTLHDLPLMQKLLVEEIED